MEPVASSYRDAAGFIFKKEDLFYRYIAPQYFAAYDLLISSGLYESLTAASRLVKHEEIKDTTGFQLPEQNGRVILPEQIPFISYPYEWSFDMWRDAAIVTLKIAAASLEKGMVLKDTTPFNIQFYNGRPVFIDTLSFEKYTEGDSWVAYRQFCECFLAPLLLMHYDHRDMGKLFLSYPDGIPLDITRSLLPAKSKWNMHAYLHIWLQAKISAKAKKTGEEKNKPLSKSKLQMLLKGLTGFIEKLKPKESASEWGNYYAETVLGNEYLEAKTKIIKDFTQELPFKTMIDLGANDGFFSILLKDKATHIVATDADSVCINELYRRTRKEKIKNILPLVSVLNNPSPAIGWANAERDSLTTRLQADLVLALALIHHLAITANLPIEYIAKRLHEMCHDLIIEFVPPADEKVQQLVKNRRDVLREYNEDVFRKAFNRYFQITREEKIASTGRILFLMKKR